MKKQGEKKPRAVSAKAAGNKPAKKKRPKKLTVRDKLQVVLAAAAVVLVAAVSSLAVIYIHSVRARDQALPVDIAVYYPREKTPAAPADDTEDPLPSGYPQRIEEPLPGSRGALVFVIDDAGHNLRDLQPFLNFPGALTIAVLPGLPYSAEAARRVRDAGKELFLHQPMESIGGTDPGPGAIMAGMDGEEIRSIISRNLEELWPVAGMNNHEGSRITMDADAMETIIALSDEKGILFLDSRTTAQTAAAQAARQLGIRIGVRDIFVDNNQDRQSMIYFINRGLSVAEQRGAAIMIGHAWSPELAPLLTEMYADLIQRGFSFSSVADVVARQ